MAIRSKKRSVELFDLMQFIEFINLFRSIERLVWFKGVQGKERDGEHTFQLAIVCWYANERLKLGMDKARLIEYALVHDLVEAYAGDTPAFGRDLGDGNIIHSRNDKNTREAQAFERISAMFAKTFPQMIARMQSYETRSDEESSFVYAMDKLLPCINVYQDNGRSYHILNVNPETHDLYKRPKISAHKVVLELYDELHALTMKKKGNLISSNSRASQVTGSLF